MSDKTVRFLESFKRQAEFRSTNKADAPEVREEAIHLERYLNSRLQAVRSPARATTSTRKALVATAAK